MTCVRQPLPLAVSAYEWEKWYTESLAERELVVVVRVTEAEFEGLVVEALDSLPEDLLEALDNIDVTIQEMPSASQLRRMGITQGTLLGLYEGIPLTERNSGYSMVLPDKITIFKRPIERLCATREDIVAHVRQTVIHEVAHHFGIDDDRLDELGWA